MIKTLAWIFGIAVAVGLIGLTRYFWKQGPATRLPAIETRPSSTAPMPNPGNAPTSSAKPPPSTGDTAIVEQEKADRDLAVVLALKTDQKWIEARDALRKFLAAYPQNERLQEAKAMLGMVNTSILFSRIPAPEKVEHVVSSGESLARIAAKYNVPIALIKKSNGLTSDVVHEGDRLWLTPAKFSILVEKSKMMLTVFDHDQFFKNYSVGLGTENGTPTGEFTITERVAEPTWWREDGRTISYGDPQNILGTHWLSLNIPHYGIHGTWEPQTIGTQSSRGCIRLLNSDIEELYTILPRGTSVRIID